MPMMQPDPASSFREEKEFRGKVYRMLSLGLDTTEIENLLGKRIDWSLFSEDTLRNFVENEHKIYVQMPDTSQTVVNPLRFHLNYMSYRNDRIIKALYKGLKSLIIRLMILMFIGLVILSALFVRTF